MVLVPKNSSIKLRITLVATFSDSDSSELVLSLSLTNLADAALQVQTAFPYLRGVRMSANATTDLGIMPLETGKPNTKAWGGDKGTVRFFRQNLTLEDTIGFPRLLA
jgi:hypothetical protein